MRNKRKISRLIDNCSAHNIKSDFEAIKVFFLPKNMTSILQPIDQGVIEFF